MAEKRLIDANAIQFEPDPWGGANCVLCVGRSGGKTMATVLEALKKMVDNASTVDAVEVVHGRWEMIGHGYAKCTNCGKIFEALPTPMFFKENNKYCRNCGAKMDGDGNV